MPNEKVCVNDIWVNKKHGTHYEVLRLTKDSETLEDRVVYAPLNGVNTDWDRPLNLFLEKFELIERGIQS